MSKPKANIEELILAKQQGKQTALQRKHQFLQFQIAMENAFEKILETKAAAEGTGNLMNSPDNQSDDMVIDEGNTLSLKK